MGLNWNLYPMVTPLYLLAVPGRNALKGTSFSFQKVNMNVPIVIRKIRNGILIILYGKSFYIYFFLNSFLYYKEYINILHDSQQYRYLK